MFGDLLGVVAGVVVGEKVREVTKDVGHSVLGSREGEDELTDVVDIASIGLGIGTGLAIFDLFDDE